MKACLCLLAAILGAEGANLRETLKQNIRGPGDGSNLNLNDVSCL